MRLTREPLNLEETVGFLQQAWDINRQLEHIPAHIRGSVFVAAAIMATSQTILEQGVARDHSFKDLLPQHLVKLAREAMLVADAQTDVQKAAYYLGESILGIKGEWMACFKEEIMK